MARPGQRGEKRDYAAEYRARIERLLAEGYSRPQARGHVRTKEIHDDKGRVQVVRLERPIRVERVRDRVEADRRKVFGGDLPRRQRGETAAAYAQRLEAERYTDKALPGKYEWEDMDRFMEKMRDEGLTEHEGFDLWFGY